MKQKYNEEYLAGGRRCERLSGAGAGGRRHRHRQRHRRGRGGGRPRAHEGELAVYHVVIHTVGSLPSCCLPFYYLYLVNYRSVNLIF